MSSHREDLGVDGNEARRLFWELCASRAPVINPFAGVESAEAVAAWADKMLAEWDDRWIAEDAVRGEREVRSDALASLCRAGGHSRVEGAAWCLCGHKLYPEAKP